MKSHDVRVPSARKPWPCGLVFCFVFLTLLQAPGFFCFSVTASDVSFSIEESGGAGALLGEGARVLKQRRFKASLVLFKKGLRKLDRIAAVEKDETVVKELRGKFYFDMAIAYQGLRDMKDATLYYRKAYEVMPIPKYQNAFRRAAIRLVFMTVDGLLVSERYEEVATIAEKYITRFNMTPEEQASMQSRIGQAYMGMGGGSIRKACKAFKMAASLDQKAETYRDDFFRCRNQYVVEYAEEAITQEAYGKAKRVLVRALRMDKTGDLYVRATMNYQLARICHSLHQRAEALVRINAALAFEPMKDQYRLLKREILAAHSP